MRRSESSAPEPSFSPIRIVNSVIGLVDEESEERLGIGRLRTRWKNVCVRNASGWIYLVICTYSNQLDP